MARGGPPTTSVCQHTTALRCVSRKGADASEPRYGCTVFPSEAVPMIRLVICPRPSPAGTEPCRRVVVPTYRRWKALDGRPPRMKRSCLADCRRAPRQAPGRKAVPVVVAGDQPADLIPLPAYGQPAVPALRVPATPEAGNVGSKPALSLVKENYGVGDVIGPWRRSAEKQGYSRRVATVPPSLRSPSCSAPPWQASHSARPCWAASTRTRTRGPGGCRGLSSRSPSARAPPWSS